MVTDRGDDTRDCPHDCHGSLGLLYEDAEDASAGPPSATPTSDENEDQDHDEDEGEGEDTEVVAVCHTCRCTPDGEFLSPETFEWYSPYTGAGTDYAGRSPHPSRVQMVAPDGWRECGDRRGHDRYSGSRKVRLAGGYDAVYDEDETDRPHGVGGEYTFDLTTL